MEVHQDGFCQNNEPQNKAPKPAMCEQTPRGTKGVLVYSYGLLQDWAELLAAEEPMNACHERLMHGAYDQGAAPDVHLYAAPHYHPPVPWSGVGPMVQVPPQAWGIAEVREPEPTARKSTTEWLNTTCMLCGPRFMRDGVVAVSTRVTAVCPLLGLERLSSTAGHRLTYPTSRHNNKWLHHIISTGYSMHSGVIIHYYQPTFTAWNRVITPAAKRADVAVPSLPSQMPHRFAPVTQPNLAV